jgi:uncharacterized membrane protein
MMLIIHVVSASIALSLGAALLALNKRLPLHARLGPIYHWTMLVVAVAALAISVQRGRAVIFTYLAPPSYALALLGYVSARRRFAGWLRWHITGQTGSYVALLTAFGIQLASRFVPRELIAVHPQVALWTLLLVPAAVASPFISRTQLRWNRKPKPRLKAAA